VRDSTRSLRSSGAVIGFVVCGAVLTFIGFLLVRTFPALAGPLGGATNDVRALLHVSTSEPCILFPPGRETNAFRNDFEAYKRTQMALIKSRLVLDHALRRPEVYRLDVVKQQTDPVGWLAKNLRVDLDASPEILRISMSGIPPQDAVVLVNAVVHAFQEEVVDLETKGKRDRYDKFKELWNRYQESLRDKRGELRRLSERVRTEEGGDLPGQKQELSACKSELLRIRLEKVASETKLKRRKAAKEPGDETRKAIAELEEGLAVLSAQEDVLKREERRLLDEPRTVIRQSVDLSSIREEIEAAEAVARRIGAEVEKLNVELQAPPRIRVIEMAAIPHP
jgi:hypothetical protein